MIRQLYPVIVVALICLPTIIYCELQYRKRRP